MKQGTMYYDGECGRYNFDYKSSESYVCDYGGFHCGDCLEVLLNGSWVVTRIEMDADRQWYLVGLPGLELVGLEVRCE